MGTALGSSLEQVSLSRLLPGSAKGSNILIVSQQSALILTPVWAQCHRLVTPNSVYCTNSFVSRTKACGTFAANEYLFLSVSFVALPFTADAGLRELGRFKDRASI